MPPFSIDNMIRVEREAIQALSREEAIDRLLQLEEALRDDVHVPFEWGLTYREVQVFNLLLHNRLVRVDAMLAFMYGNDPNGGPNSHISAVYISKLRRKLSPHGIEIHTIWNQGWYLAPDLRAHLLAQYCRRNVAA